MADPERTRGQVGHLEGSRCPSIHDGYRGVGLHRQVGDRSRTAGPWRLAGLRRRHPTIILEVMCNRPTSVLSAWRTSQTIRM